MKYLVATAALAFGLFVTSGKASAQHYGGHHHGSHHGGHHGYHHGGYSAPGIGVYSYSVPSSGGYFSQGYGTGIYAAPGVGVRVGPVYRDGYHDGYGHYRHHHHR